MRLLPVRSEATELGSKTLYVQRLKLNGTDLGKAGAQMIRDLRGVVLSRVWDAAYGRGFEHSSKPK
jgi:hypothetical protein